MVDAVPEELKATVYRYALQDQPKNWRDPRCELVGLSTQSIERQQLVGSGAYAHVYKCQCTAAEKTKDGGVKVRRKTKAVKVLHQETEVAHTLVEVRILRNLQHCPQIIKLHDVLRNVAGEVNGLVFDYVRTMAKVEEQYLALKPNDVRYCMRQLLQGLDYCHSRAIMHRDIKPANLLIDPSNRRLVIIDFGQATFYMAEEKYRHVVGSIAYNAPELLLGAKHYHYAVDIWSAGRVFFNMLVPQAGYLLKAPPAKPQSLRQRKKLAANESTVKQRERKVTADRERQLRCLACKFGGDAIVRLVRRLKLPAEHISHWFDIVNKQAKTSRERSRSKRLDSEGEIDRTSPSSSPLSLQPLSWQDFVALAQTPTEADKKTKARRVANYLTLDAIDLLNNLLMLDPSMRITARDALQHRYFKPIESWPIVRDTGDVEGDGDCDSGGEEQYEIIEPPDSFSQLNSPWLAH